MNLLKETKYLVIGGGIAGVTCAETLSALCPEETIVLLTASSLVKAVTNFNQISKTLEEFDIEEKPYNEIEIDSPNVQVLHKTVSQLDTKKQIVTTVDGSLIHYEKLCLCIGAKPKLISNSPYVLGIRDTESVQTFQERLGSAKQIMVVGNGGIATELVYEIENCSVIWAIKDESINHAFVDAPAGKFLLKKLHERKEKSKTSKRMKYTMAESDNSKTDEMGGALGPDWASTLTMSSNLKITKNVHMEYKVEVERLLTAEELKAASLEPTSSPLDDHNDEKYDWPIYVSLSNGKIYGCDFLVSATGVMPNTDVILQGNSFDLANDGGIKVNSKMQTNIPNVFSAGDLCNASWEMAEHWFQMRLWTQARQMGAYAAKCMVSEINNMEISMDFCFELFAHVTRFFNHKVVLLGKYNAQGLGNDYELLLRIDDDEFVKVVLSNNRMQGALLIGETDLEETFENLILNQMDLSCFKENLLEPGDRKSVV